MKENEITQTNTRKAGVLMPVSALPSPFGIGTLGAGAYAFVDWLKSAGMKIWQVLPLLPTGYGDSPYQSCASNALNYYFIDFDELEKDGLLQKQDYQIVWGADERRVDYGKQFHHKIEVLKKAFARFNREDKKWRSFLKDGKYAEFALFMSLKTRFGYAPWEAWDKPFKNAETQALDMHKKEHAEEILFWQFTQFLFLKQWNALHAYANEKGVEIMGDMPIYLSYDSVETWLHRKELFMLDKRGNISKRAGVPPDAFSADGQFWGNPVYDWKKQKRDGYAWWKARINDAFALFDSIRIDHFRAFDRFYAIPSDAETAKEGKWLPGPKSALFKDFKDKSIIAEDLGTIDDGVRKLLKDTGYAGMKVFAFAFDGNDKNEYLPCYYNENCVAYTGTHDNDTMRSWLESMDRESLRAFRKETEKQCLLADVPYIRESVEDEVQSIIELLFYSKANVVIVPMQDVLCFGNEARLNAPSTVSQSNWTFRFLEEDFKRRKAAWLKELTEKYNR